MTMKKFFVIALSALLMMMAIGLIYVNFTLPPGIKEYKVRMSSLGRGTSGDEYVTAILNCSLSEVPNTLSALKVVGHNYTDAEAKAIAMEVFDMKGKLNITRFNWTAYGPVLVVNGTQALELYVDGALCYRPNSQEEGYDVKLPELSQAKEVADQFVEIFVKKAKSHGLMPSFPSIDFSKVDYVCWYGIPPRSTVPTEIGVGYKTLYNGIPLIFKGGIGVIIGDNGKILEFRCFWRNVEFAEAMPVTVSPEQAIQNMGNNSLVGRDPHKIQKITINSVELGYFAPPPLLSVNEFLPAYEIEFVATFEDGSQNVYVTYVSATDTPVPY